MKEFENNAYFWQKVDASYLSGDYQVIYKKGTTHPKYPDLVFPIDYGHIKTGEDDTLLKVFKGSKNDKIESVVVCANLLEKDLNAIALVGLDEKEEEAVLKFLNSNDFQKCVIFKRGKDIPSWAVTE